MNKLKLSMNRREALSGVLAAALVGASGPAAAQAARPRRIGFLMGFSEDDRRLQASVKVFREGLHAVGLTEGRNVQIDYRWAAGDAEMARTHARELVALNPDLIVASTNQVVSIVMKETKTIPIVFVFIGDPIGSGFAATIAKPGGNLTGFANFEAPIGGKWLEMLKEVAPQTQRVGFVYHPAVTPHLEFLEVARATAPSLGLALTALAVKSAAEIEEQISAFGKAGENGAIVVAPHALTLAQRSQIVGLASHYRLAGVYGDGYFSEVGGLLSFGINLPDQLRRATTYIDVIFKGAKPGDLPVQLPVKYELLINLPAAKALGIEVPPALLARADGIIE
jgi:putative tryptophan/tyrosine transport system substrate-binding protein